VEQTFGGPVKIAFCFPGQGSQEVGMGRAFAEALPAVRAVYAEASEATGLDLERICFEGALEELTETEIQQPALVTTSIACLRGLEEAGVRPDYVVGHSVGEHSALAAAGVLGVRDAARVVAARGRATAEAARETPGSMAAILGLEDEVVESICAEIDGVWPANYNCPGQIVVSGSDAAVAQLIETATRRGARRAVKLRVTGAFHSPLVANAGARLRPVLDSLTWKEPSVAFLSSVTAQIEGADRIPGLLVEQLTAPVRFTQCVARLVEEGVGLFVEVGPGQVLSGLVKRCDRTVTAMSVSDPESLATLEEVLSSGR
jgi:[acyl-carrier-protein] S-malonyltransferase